MFLSRLEGGKMVCSFVCAGLEARAACRNIYIYMVLQEIKKRGAIKG